MLLTFMKMLVSIIPLSKKIGEDFIIGTHVFNISGSMNLVPVFIFIPTFEMVMQSIDHLF